MLTNPAEGRTLTEEAQVQFAREAGETDLYGLACPDLARALPGAEWRIGPVVVKP